MPIFWFVYGLCWLFQSPLVVVSASWGQCSIPFAVESIIHLLKCTTRCSSHFFPSLIPAIILTWIVFTASTDSYLWTLCAGILGGPILALSGLVLFFDKSSTIEPTKENVERSSKLIGTVYYILTPVGAFFWWCLMNVTYQMYGLSLSSVWNDLWVNAGPSVAFMTIDTGVLYLGVILYIAYHNEIKALKALALTPVVGPGASCCFVMKELESEAAASLLAKGKKQA